MICDRGSFVNARRMTERFLPRPRNSPKINATSPINIYFHRVRWFGLLASEVSIGSCRDQKAGPRVYAANSEGRCFSTPTSFPSSFLVGKIQKRRARFQFENRFEISVVARRTVLRFNESLFFIIKSNVVAFSGGRRGKEKVGLALPHMREFSRDSPENCRLFFQPAAWKFMSRRAALYLRYREFPRYL